MKDQLQLLTKLSTTILYELLILTPYNLKTTML